jgi:hypothetical protein
VWLDASCEITAPWDLPVRFAVFSLYSNYNAAPVECQMIGLQNKAEDDFLPGGTKEQKQSLAIFAVTRYNKLILSTYF